MNRHNALDIASAVAAFSLLVLVLWLSHKHLQRELDRFDRQHQIQRSQ